MSTVKEIKEAIRQLDVGERDEIFEFLACDIADDDWDRQIAADAAAGRLDHLIEEAWKDHAEGKTRPFP